MARDLVAAFWAKVDKVSHPGGCWLYTGFRKWDGYGWLARTTNGKTRYLTAHRYAWMLTHGEPAAGLHILHQCDNPPCCNPSHLRLGTHQQNMADQRAKGRHVHGERNRRNTLVYEQVVEIRKLQAEGQHWKAIAAKLGIVPNRLVYCVTSGKTWKHCTGPTPLLHPNRVRPERKQAA